MKKKAWVFDIDGTLANTDHRIHHLKPPEGGKKNWGAFFGNAYKDSVYEHVAHINALIASQEDYVDGLTSIILVTARPANLMEDTEDWLNKNHIGYDQIFMRPVNERKPDFEVKRDIYREKIKPDYDVICVFEDRLQVAKMWREEGVPVLLCGDEWLKNDWSE